MLLSDWVFTQHPRSLQRVVQLVCDEVGLRQAVGESRNRLGHRDALTLPDGSGRRELFMECMRVLDRTPAADYSSALCEAAQSNGRKAELVDEWLAHAEKAVGEQRTRWFRYGLLLGAMPQAEDQDVEKLLSDDPVVPARLAALVDGRKHHIVSTRPERVAALIQGILDDRVTLALRRHERMPAVVGLSAAFVIPEMLVLTQYLGNTPREIASQLWSENLLTGDDADGPSNGETQARSVFEAFAQYADTPIESWIQSLDAWNAIAERSRTCWGDSYAVAKLANLAAGIRDRTETCTDTPDMFDTDAMICRRARYARLRAGSQAWWRRTLSEANDARRRFFGLLVLLSWGSSSTIRAVLDELDDAINSLPPFEAGRLIESSVRLRITGGLSTVPQVRLTVRDIPTSCSPRTVAAIAAVSGEKTARPLVQSRLADYSGSERAILETATRWLYPRPSSSAADWDRFARLARRAYRAGCISYLPYRRGLQGMPESLAITVTDNPADYPIAFSAACEHRSRELLSRKMTPVPQTAARRSGSRTARALDLRESQRWLRVWRFGGRSLGSSPTIFRRIRTFSPWLIPPYAPRAIPPATPKKMRPPPAWSIAIGLV